MPVVSGSPRPRGKLGRRLAALVVTLAIVPAGVLGYVLIGVNQASLEDTTRDLLFSAIDNVAQQVDRSLDEATTSLIAIRGVLGNEALDARARVEIATQIVAASTALDVVAIYDETGAQVDVVRDAGRTEPVPTTLPVASRPARDRSEPVAGAVEVVPGGLVSPLVIAVPIGDHTWYAYAPLSLAPLDVAVASAATSALGATPGSVFVVDRQLRVIADGDPERVTALARADAEIVRDLASTPVDEEFLAFRRYDNARGEMVGAVRTLRSLPFAVVAELPVERAYASVAQMRLAVIVVVLIAMLASAMLALLVVRRLSAPVDHLVRFAGDLAARRFDAPLTVASGDDLEVLGDAMRDAAQALARGEDLLRKEQTIRADLGRYLPKQLVERIVTREQSLALGGQRRIVTVLFADVTSFSSLVEQREPEVVVSILNQLFTILTELVFRHGGTVDKFIGDSVMAFWNAPDDQPDHAARAVASSIDMMRWLETVNEAWQAQHGVTVRLAIGIHTGEVVIGNFGSETRMEYTCIGEAVNLAARLESIARPSQILVSRATHDAAGDAYPYIEFGPQRIPSRLDPVEVFEVAS